jgi:hypothetical protein
MLGEGQQGVRGVAAALLLGEAVPQGVRVRLLGSGAGGLPAGEEVRTVRFQVGAGQGAGAGPVGAFGVGAGDRGVPAGLGVALPVLRGAVDRLVAIAAGRGGAHRNDCLSIL